WVDRQTAIEPDQVLVLVDTSASMSIHDTDTSRIQLARDAVNAITATPPEADRITAWYTFTDSIDPLTPSDSGEVVIADPSGGPSEIGSCVAHALKRHSGFPVAGVVLVTDGRGQLSGGRSAAMRSGVPLIVVPTGDRSGVPDVQMTRVWAPEVAFSNDAIPLQVSLHSDASLSSHDVTLTITDDLGTSLDPIHITDALVEQGVLNRPLPPALPGLRTWTVDLQVDGRSLDTEVVQVDVRDRAARVLLVEGKPRFLHRFLVPLLTRESSIEVSVLLQSADPNAAPEGDVPIRRLPQTQEEIDAFDLVIFGDADPALMTDTQLDLIATHVADGGGVLWIPGGDIPMSAWQDTPLAPFMPIVPSAHQSIVRGQARETDNSAALAIPAPPSYPLEWAIHVDAFRPQARVLLDLLLPGTTEAVPLVAMMPTGGGRSGWIGSDDMWRWRRTTQRAQAESLVLNLIRLLARDVTPVEPLIRVLPEPIVGQVSTVVLEGDVPEASGTQRVVEVTNEAGTTLSEIHLHADGDVWRGTWQPIRAGTTHLESDDVYTSIAVRPLHTEDMRFGVDEAALQDLVDDTRGALIAVNDAGSIMHLFPSRARHTQRSITVGPALGWVLWSALAVFLTLEWGLRRWNALA
ncbi:MAG: hypothetical protein MK074_09600, partial [Phycisphaerales bacterium]|nr:hypothetical protein [Phycisphaerales bacterium]